MVDERDVRAAVYVRVSTQEQVEGTSLDVQRQACRSHAERLGWRVAAEFADEGVSGSLGNRPALDELLTACRGGLIDAVVVHRLDRFGRSLRHLSNTLGELDEIGVQFVSVQEAFDSHGSAGRLQRNILSSVAQFEREQMVERSRSGLRAKVEAGWWPGGPPPFGFDLERVGRHLRLVVNETEAAVVRRVAELIVDEDCTVAQCAQRLNQEGLGPARRPPGSSTTCAARSSKAAGPGSGATGGEAAGNAPATRE